MAGDFDPYQKWLGIPPEHQPPDRYRLLGVEQFESDLEVIDAAADELMYFVQEKAVGVQARYAEKLLSQIAMARVGLIDPDEKKRYDEKLKKKLAAAATTPSQPKRPVGKKRPVEKRRSPASSSNRPADKTSQVIPLSPSEVTPQKPRSTSTSSEDSRRSAPTGGNPKSPTRSRTGRPVRRQPVEDTQEQEEEFEPSGGSSRNVQLAVVVFAVLAGGIGVGAIVWSMKSGVQDNRVVARKPADRESSTEATASKSKTPAAKADDNDFELPDAPSTPLPTAAKPIRDASGDIPKTSVSSGSPSFGGDQATDDTVAVGPGSDASDTALTDEEEEEDDYAEEEDDLLIGGGVIAGLDDPSPDADEQDELPEERQPEERQPEEEQPVASSEKPKADNTTSESSSESSGESIIVSVAPPEVSTSPTWRARKDGENAEDYLTAIGLVKVDGQWALALEKNSQQAVDDFNAFFDTIREDREKARLAYKATSDKLGSKQRSKDAKELKKKIRKLKQATQKAEIAAFKATWAENKKKLAALSPIDWKDRLQRSQELEFVFSLAKKKYTIEYGSLTHGGIYSQLGEGDQAEKIDDEYQEQKTAFQAIETSYKKAYAHELAQAKELLTLGRRAAAQYERVQFEYEVLSSISAVAEATEELKATLGPTKPFVSLASKASRCPADGLRNISQLRETEPFSESLFHLPDREVVAEEEGEDTAAKLDPMFAALNVNQEPKASLLARGLKQRRDQWLLDVERQLTIDLDLSTIILREITRLTELFPEEHEAAMAASKAKWSGLQKAIDDDFRKRVLVNGVLNQQALGGWRDRKRKQLAGSYPVDQAEKKFLAVQDAIAELEEARRDLLSKAQDQMVKVGEAYGMLYEEDDIATAFESVGGAAEPSADFNSAVNRLQELVNQDK